MIFSIKNSFKSSIKSSIIILKLVVPIYILADILFYYNLLEYITFIFEPITSFLNLPSEAALSIVSGVFLNLYAAPTFATLSLLFKINWTVESLNSLLYLLVLIFNPYSFYFNLELFNS